MSNSVLELHGFMVYRGTGKKVLDIEELVVRRKELVAVVGPNGTGKSTLLQAVNLLLPHRGKMLLFGLDCNREDATKLRRRSAMVFQETLLLRTSVYNNLAWALRFRGIPSREIQPRVLKALKDFRCDHLTNRPAWSLSGGEAQRVSIARALVTAPELLLLDEPFAALDATLRKQMIEEIRQLAVARGLTVLLVSHDFSDVLHFADRAVAVFNGSIVQDDKPEALMRRPTDEQVAKLVGMDNILPCSVMRDGSGWLVNVSDGFKFSCAREFRHSITACCIPGDALSIIGKDNSQQDGTRVVFNGLVQRVIPGVGVSQVVVTVGGLTLTIMVPRAVINSEIHAQATVTLAFDPADAHFI